MRINECTISSLELMESNHKIPEQRLLKMLLADKGFEFSGLFSMIPVGIIIRTEDPARDEYNFRQVIY